MKPDFLSIPDPVPDRFVLSAYRVNEHTVQELRYTYYEGPISHDEVCALHRDEPLHGVGSGVEWVKDWRCESRPVLGRWAPLEGEASFTCGGRSDTESMRRWFRDRDGIFETLIEAARRLVDDERKRVKNAENNLATARAWLEYAEAHVVTAEVKEG